MNKVLVIIPAYNEEETLGDLLHELKSKNGYFDVLVVNDGSIDDTSLVASSVNGVEVVDLPYNMGIGASVQTGFRYAWEHNYDCALQIDADGQHKVDEIDKLIHLIDNENADVAIGSRFTREHDGFKSAPLRRLGIRIFEYVSFVLIRQRVTDHTSGFRAYNRKAIGFLKDNYPMDFPEPEVVILMGRNGFTIKETFTQMLERQGGVSSIPVTKGPYYMIKVLLSMVMASIRSKKI